MNNEADLKIINGVRMMGSRSIAAMTGKDHSSVVVRDIKNILKQLEIYPATQQDTDCNEYFIVRKEYNGRDVIDEIWLSQVLSKTLVTGYSVKDRYKLAKRWEELEIEAAQPSLVPPPAQPPQAAPAIDHILSIARVVAESTVSATMKVMMEVIDEQQKQAEKARKFESERQGLLDIFEYFRLKNTNKIANPEPEAVITAPVPRQGSEFALVTNLVWDFGLSDTSCRHLVSYSNLPTQLTNGERGHLQVHYASFAEAVLTLIEESTPPTGKRKRWQHPDFGNFSLKITEANKAAVEAKL